MRLDKYLKVSRILKRRTISKQLAANQRVLVNGKIAKPAKEVGVGDVIDVIYGERGLKVRVLDVSPVVRKGEAGSLYEVLDEYQVSEEERLNLG
ncbi:MAG: RNA-binding S4 domain-containing protein [Erysipelotrichaceae bacterium]|nr:RNA-binding S4 domain-containing protein [Erysipelotrichaceae bacterium]MBR5048359.1 RNA-binding S4 domain-containing protein [Erysipelotrichaceae bacterium]